MRFLAAVVASVALPSGAIWCRASADVRSLAGDLYLGGAFWFINGPKLFRVSS